MQLRPLPNTGELLREGGTLDWGRDGGWHPGLG